MALHLDEDEQDNYSSIDEEDEVFKEDMATLVQACMIGASDEAIEEIYTEDQHLVAGSTVVETDTNIVSNSSDFDSDHEQSDLECLKRVQKLYKSSTSPPLITTTTTTMITAFDSDNDEDDLEMAHAILKRFSTCEEGDIASNDKVKTSPDSSESEYSDDMTLISFVETKSKKRQSKCTKNMSQDSSSSETKR